MAEEEREKVGKGQRDLEREGNERGRNGRGWEEGVDGRMWGRRAEMAGEEG